MNSAGSPSQKAGTSSSGSSRISFWRQSTTATKPSTATAKEVLTKPRSRRRCTVSSKQHLLLAFGLILLFLLGTAQSNPVFNHHTASGGPSSSSLESTVHKARFSKQQLISRYNFHCIGPNDVKPHDGFTSEPPPTTNASLTELRNDLHYIRSMVEKLKSISSMGTTMENTIDVDATQTLPNLPNPIPLDDGEDINYTKAFNSSNHLLMKYLNGLAQAEMSMIESASLGTRLFNITDIEYELAAWLHKLHLKMIQNSVDIDCEGIKALLRAPPTAMEKVHRKDYMPLLMRKLMGIMGNVIEIFERAIKHESIAEQRTDGNKKRAYGLNAPEPEMGKRRVNKKSKNSKGRRKDSSYSQASQQLNRIFRETEGETEEVGSGAENNNNDNNRVAALREHTWLNFNKPKVSKERYSRPRYASFSEEDE